MIGRIFLIVLIFFSFSIAGLCRGNTIMSMKKINSLSFSLRVSFCLDSACVGMSQEILSPTFRYLAEMYMQTIISSNDMYFGYTYDCIVVDDDREEECLAGSMVSRVFIYSLKEESDTLELKEKIKEDTVTIAILKNSIGFSWEHAGIFRGVDVLHGKKIGYFLGKEIKFLKLDSKGDCLKAVLDKRADLTIASIDTNMAMGRKLRKSISYFRTGAVISYIDPQTFKVVSRDRFDVPELKTYVLKNSSAHVLANSFLREGSVSAFNSWVDLYNPIFNKNEGTFIVVLINEISALAAPHSFVLEYNGKRCWTWDRYVVVARSKKLIRAVNLIIEKVGIEKYYANLAGRNERK